MSKSGAVIAIIVTLVAALIAWRLILVRNEDSSLAGPEMSMAAWYSAFNLDDPQGARKLILSQGQYRVKNWMVSNAASKGKAKVLAAFLESGWPSDGVDKDGALLTYAVGQNQVESVRVLLLHGASLELHPKGTPPVIVLASMSKKRLPVLRQLITAGANLEVVGTVKFGRTLKGPWKSETGTALQIAVRRGNVEGTRALISAGANTAVVDSDGRTLIEIAKERGFREIEELLSQR